MSVGNGRQAVHHEHVAALAAMRDRQPKQMAPAPKVEYGPAVKPYVRSDDPNHIDLHVNVWRDAHRFYGGEAFLSPLGERLSVALEACPDVKRRKARLWWEDYHALPSITRAEYTGYQWVDGSGIVLLDDHWVTVALDGTTQGGRCEWLWTHHTPKEAP